ncbi:hypothetical protein HHK36_008182 [Tetracentron sinense]|uniref:Glycosyltransferase n=1 Tax=Tetracentron sinense TaxID=13715 RepID=A0A834ZPP2_TETSI|nr:hypothetical protein HHK36_008182 [Tetracentron sinense]
MESKSLPSMTDSNGRLHVVMFPWLAFGHIVPFLELSECMARRGHHVSFVSTPRNILRLPKLPPHLAPLIELVNLPFPYHHHPNLPQNAESTTDVPPHMVKFLKKAFDDLQEPFARFLENSAPDWLIYDFAPHWLPPIAAKLGIPCVFFSIFQAASLAFFGPPSVLLGIDDPPTEPEHFTVPPKWVPFPSNRVFRLHEIRRTFENFSQGPGVTDLNRLGSTIQGCDVVAVRNYREYEPQWFGLLEEELYKKPVIPLGLLPPATQNGIDEKDEKWVPIREWLDRQGKRSVVYIALGSEAPLSKDEVTELALGLELSEFPFFWVLRKTPGSAEDDSELLPDGFEERVKGRGVVCMAWVPQVRILGHPSVGVFLTHCGWSSVIEALMFGCPLVLLPLFVDQGLICRGFVEKKMGLEMARDEGDGSFKRESVAECLRLVMVDEQGEIYRKKAREMREIFGDRDRHDRYVDDFVRYLQEHRGSAKAP